MQTIFSTDDVAERERFSYWCDVACHTYMGVRAERAGTAPFFGRISKLQLAQLSVTEVHTGDHRVFRGRREISQSPMEYYLVGFTSVGSGTHLARGGMCSITSDKVIVIDSRYPCELEFGPGWRGVDVVVPQHILRPRLANTNLAGLTLDGGSGVGALVSVYLRTLVQQRMAEPVKGSVADILVNLLAVAIGATADAAHAATPGVREARRQAIRQYVERNLADPSLTPAGVARTMRMSTRYLHGLFNESGETLMRWVLSRRPERCRDDLSDPAKSARPIADIAFGWGFQDVSHFSRAFKTAFGMTPRDWRKMAEQETGAR